MVSSLFLTPPHFVLASASPARRKLLQTVGIDPIIRHSQFDESQIRCKDPIKLVQILAHYKAKTVAPYFQDCLILGCDSLLVVRGEIYGKPNSSEEAIVRWQKIRGNQGTLYTGHTIIDQKQQKTLIRCGITQVYFANLNDVSIEAYVNTGEPLKCAGCFALDGKGGLFIDRIEGCHSNVIGLSLPLLRQMLEELGYQFIQFWSNP
ncbi:MAG: Maf family protein [cyanobacterium endosymbiont of Rhopalodia musculus]|uniref:Maf family protein n=1 Tax=cyanobacterium endosymbiont of Epithemia clementina EcSB TaxID=3034674 RepID=UPI00248061BF|nr:nucleoside triphosphate pyrophosphatase [cyanobacterium endosymbiont of Epithemia clementina EcSB]WGT67438.1 Maf family protein [cyanobacterium endosymbiont of Epithemia clementina EcSB]